MQIKAYDTEFYIDFEYRVIDQNGRIYYGLNNLDRKGRVQTYCLINKKEVFLEEPRSVTVAQGLSIQSKKDRFNKSLGRRKALGRALIDLTTDKDIRSRIWRQYFNSVDKQFSKDI